MTEYADVKGKPTIEELAATLAASTPKLPPAEQSTALALFRLLAEGSPVSAQALAQHTGLELREVEAQLERLPSVVRDGDGRVLAFFGLALPGTPPETAHRVEVDGRRFNAWCALDTLVHPELLRKPARVESCCPTTGERISLVVDPNGVRELSPPGAVVSALAPAPADRGEFAQNVFARFCCFVHYFSSPEAGEAWVAEHPGTFLLSVDEAFELARRLNHDLLGVALSG
jgi:alkylmercury lyase